MKSVFIGCAESSRRALEKLMTCDGIDIAGVITRESSSFNSDFVSLKTIADEHGIPVFFADGRSKEDMAKWIQSHNPDVGFCVGWSFLLPSQILEIPQHGFVGYHPALLPRNRGRHPIIWALALGLDETGSTFFIMDEGADSGDIISQERIHIRKNDDADSLYSRLLDLLDKQILDITTHLVAGTLKRIPQDNAAATYWRKRSKRDGEIDWRMPAEGIRNLVRALAAPYPGAHCIINNQEYKVHKVETIDADLNLEPGRVLSVADNIITIKAGVDAVRLTQHGINNLPKPLDCLI
jgi:methionyl-tRNA formyltransferase